jgi:hypothetical protein
MAVVQRTCSQEEKIQHMMQRGVKTSQTKPRNSSKKKMKRISKHRGIEVFKLENSKNSSETDSDLEFGQIKVVKKQKKLSKKEVNQNLTI